MPDAEEGVPVSTRTPKNTGGGKAAAKRSARERVEAMREAERRAERRRWISAMAVVVVVVGALAGLATWSIVGQQRNKSALPKPVAIEGKALPPWPAPADPVAGARRVGLDVQPMEGTAKHFHAHLDVIVNGKPVPVPANLGVAGNAMSELHTHDERGVVHIEAPTANKRYVLGQLFSEWGVRLDAQGIGGLNVDGKNTLRAFVGGKEVTGNPAEIELTPHRQIALVYGPAGAKVNPPASFKFQQGE
jgi:hypothetical protein